MNMHFSSTLPLIELQTITKQRGSFQMTFRTSGVGEAEHGRSSEHHGQPMRLGCVKLNRTHQVVELQVFHVEKDSKSKKTE